MPAKRSTEESRRLHKRIRGLHARGLHPVEIAGRCGVSRGLVYYAVARPSRAERTLSEAVKMLAGRRAGRTLAEIARSGRVSVATVQRRLDLARGHEAGHLGGLAA